MRSTLKELSFEDAVAHVDDGAAFVDLRQVEEYLDVHVPGSLALLYEWGPGMQSRARDCLPLELPLVLLDLGWGDLDHAASSLRGKGFSVVGVLEDGINRWAAARGAPGSTEVVEGNRSGTKQTDGAPPLILDVGDPGAGVVQDAVKISIERLWTRVGELDPSRRVVIASGKGVRAALAVGILERAGFEDITFWKP
ncbi:MAG: rhodanese-like domain-containing protein [Actinomycetota bacterium]|nr:rhodanese-like domain-containing protein [Actinomycetota bacterium]